MDSGIGDEVGLEFSDIDVEGTIESQRGGQRGNDLGDKSVQIGVGGSFNIQLSSADIINGLIVQHDSNISVFQKGVSGQNGVVRFNNGSGNLRRGIHSVAELGFFTIINGKSLKEEGTETRSGTTTNRVEDQESLESSAVIS